MSVAYRFGPETFKKCRILADKLIASCDGGRDEQEEINGLSKEECLVLDSMILQCHVCQHWFNAKEMKDDGSQYACADCLEP